MAFQPLIKFTGSKRYVSDEIVKFFPRKISVYHEPFVGGGSVLYSVLNCNINVDNCVVSDLDQNLINLYHKIKYDPDRLINEYSEMYIDINKLKTKENRWSYYRIIRDRFNKDHSSADFFFLTRNSINGLIRYNPRSGNFNAAYNFLRPGINPERLRKIFESWKNVLNKTIFICQSYLESEILNVTDYVYCDPPYNEGDGYFGKMVVNQFFDWLRTLKCKYSFSYGSFTENTNGFKTSQKLKNVPKDLFDELIFLRSSISGFRKFRKIKDYVKETLYIRR